MNRPSEPNPLPVHLEYACGEADRLTILSSQMRQSGFTHLAKALKGSADAMRDWVVHAPRNAR